MGRLIDADKLKTHYSWWTDETKELFDTIINLQPTIEAEPIRHGKWEEIKSGDWANATEYRCSECGKYRLAVNPVNYNWNYCPNCGAKMDEVTE